jgi:hypothetical protein
LETQPEANGTPSTPQPNPANPSNPSNPGNPSPAGNLPGQPPRFRPNGEPFLVPPRALPSDAADSPPPDPDPPLAGQ